MDGGPDRKEERSWSESLKGSPRGRVERKRWNKRDIRNFKDCAVEFIGICTKFDYRESGSCLIFSMLIESQAAIHLFVSLAWLVAVFPYHLKLPQVSFRHFVDASLDLDWSDLRSQNARP